MWGINLGPWALVSEAWNEASEICWDDQRRFRLADAVEAFRLHNRLRASNDKCTHENVDLPMWRDKACAEPLVHFPSFISLAKRHVPWLSWLKMPCR